MRKVRTEGMRLLEYGGQLVFADWAHFQGGDVQKGLAETG
jgi:hypothetical protein